MTDPHKAALARWMGYDGVEAMDAEHDGLHLRLCAEFGQVSHALRQARGDRLNAEEQMLAGLEEDAVLAVQRWWRHVRGPASGMNGRSA